MKDKMIPVTFSNRENLKLFGILHEPGKNKYPDQGIIILSPGIKSRVAPHRLYVKMARKFCDLGYRVLRFDFYGLGDSEGELTEKYTADLYRSIQQGRYADDTIAAIDWMQEKFNVKSVILSGLCGGAITGLIGTEEDNRVKALVGIGIPVILDGSSMNQQAFMTSGQLGSIRESYVKKIFDYKSWIRILKCQTDFSLLAKAIANPIKNKLSQHLTLNKSRHSDHPANFNTLFPRSFFKFTKSKKLLLIFSEADRLFWEYDEKFLKPYQNKINRTDRNVSLHLIKNANHILSFKGWQEEMENVVKDWLINSGLTN